MDSVELPAQLPLLQIVNQVLLPTAFIRVHVSAKASKSVALLEYLSASHAKELLVAVLPILVGDAASTPAIVQPDTLEDARSSRIATAARILQLSRLVQSGDWVVLLEGLCRVVVPPPAASQRAPPEGFDRVAVEQLELHPAAPAAAGGGAAAAAAGGSAVGRQDAQLAELGRQLKATTRQLLKLLSLQTGLPAVRRLLEVLDAVPAWRAADVVAAALGSTPGDRWAVLQATEHKQRIRLALRLAQQALDAVRGAAGANSARGGAGAGALAGGQPGQPGARARAPGALDGGRAGGGGGGGSTKLGGLDGDDGEEEDELGALLAKLAAAGPPPEVLRAAAREARRLRSGGEQQPGASAARTYLEVLADLPWTRTARSGAPGAAGAAGGARVGTGAGAATGGVAPADGAAPAQAVDAAGTALGAPAATATPAPALPLGAGIDLRAARALLDAQHHGLGKVKSRIIEHLAVLSLRGARAKAPILCFIGPPGVGKTTLARSVADALGVPLSRIALGGVRDEAEVRGHRRTYVGAMPGRIINAMRKAGVRDALLLLDEVDKMGRDSRGDPAAALLEVLDPEQNSAFVDTYLGVAFDLSQVTFVCTANRAADIPPALLDRLEVIHLAGYTLEEKVHIAQRHLVPKLLADHGLGPQLLEFDADVLRHIVQGYTREAGVRGLSRCLAALCRHVAVEVVTAGWDAAATAATALELDAGGGGSADASAAAAAVTAPSVWDELPGAVLPPPPALSSALLSAGLQRPGAGAGVAGAVAARGALPPLLPPLARAGAAAAAAAAAARIPYDGSTPGGSPYPPDLLTTCQKLVRVSAQLVESVLGPPKHLGDEAAERVSSPGVAAGLVWTAVGGGVQYVEAACVSLGRPERAGVLTLTGQVGEVLGESARIALTWIRAHAAELGLEEGVASGSAAAGAVGRGGTRGGDALGGSRDGGRDGGGGGGGGARLPQLPALQLAPDVGGDDCLGGAGGAGSAGGAGPPELLRRWLSPASSASAAPPPALLPLPPPTPPAARAGSPALQWDIHVHLPAGAVPKDGPSAGVTLAVALLSLLSGRTVRPNTAMTGEVTLRGLVLPVGGLKEKLLAARAAGMRRVIVPARNMADVAAEAGEALQGGELEVVPAARLDQVLAAAFDPPYLLLPQPRL